MESVRTGDFAMLRLERGERLPDVLGDWARKEGIGAAAVLNGIGMIRQSEIGHLEGGRYAPHRFDEPLELLSLAGSIAIEEGAPSVHLHVSASRPDHSVVGGHLLNAEIAVLGEVAIRVVPGHRFRRPMEPALGVRALRLSEPSDR